MLYLLVLSFLIVLLIVGLPIIGFIIRFFVGDPTNYAAFDHQPKRGTTRNTEMTRAELIEHHRKKTFGMSDAEKDAYYSTRNGIPR